MGTFNIYILHPQWLAKHNIIEPGVDAAIATNFTQPGFRLTFPNQLVWTITPNRLAVESTDADVDCGGYVAKILQMLPETPLQALGNNFHYEASITELKSLPNPLSQVPAGHPSAADDEIIQRTFQVAVRHGSREVTTLQFSMKETLLELACNTHEGAEGSEFTNSRAVIAAKRFLQDASRSALLAQQLFNIQFSR